MTGPPRLTRAASPAGIVGMFDVICPHYECLPSTVQHVGDVVAPAWTFTADGSQRSAGDSMNVSELSTSLSTLRPNNEREFDQASAHAALPAQ